MCKPSPRTRGCFFVGRRLRQALVAFPAHAGMFPLRRAPERGHAGLPRARGDVSVKVGDTVIDPEPSPRTRGCFRRPRSCTHGPPAFPAHAGMFLKRRRKATWLLCLPRARGDVSIDLSGYALKAEPSPRTRGCFWLLLEKKGNKKAFPAHAGMFLR